MIRSNGRTMIRLVAVSCFFALVPTLAQEVGSGAHLTSELLQSRILEAQDSKEIDEPTRTRLIELYRLSIANLETTRANRQATEEYRQAVGRSPIEAESIRASIERRRATDPVEDLRITSSSMSDELDQTLEKELANRTAVESKLAALDARLEAESQRPTQARERIAVARMLVEEIVGETDPRSLPKQNRLLAEASRWSSEMRIEALQTEIAMLDQELLSQRARVQLLRAQRDEAALSVTRIGRRVDVLRSALNERRLREAELARAQAMAVLEGASGQERIVRDLADANLSLVELLQNQVEELDSLSGQESRARPQMVRLAEAFRSTRQKLQLYASNAPLGLAIREERRQLPNAKEYVRARRDLHRTITAVSLRLIESEDERKALRDLNEYVDNRIARVEAELLEPGVRADLEALAKTRRSLLDRASANDIAQQRRLYALDDVLRQLEERTTAYDEFLARRLIWVKSTPAIDLEAFGILPGEIAAYFSPMAWLEAARVAARRLWQAPGFLLMVLVAVLLLGRRKRIRAALVECGQNVGSIRRDSMKYTFEALAFTLLLALPGPLVLGALGWALATAAESTSFSSGVASGLLRTASLLLLLMSFRVLYEPGGVADRHFRWDRSTLTGLRRQLTWFLSLGLPLYFLTVSVVAMSPSTSGGTLGLLGFTGLMTSLAGLTVGLVHPTIGTVHHLLERRPESGWWRWRYLWYPIVVAVPVIVTALALVGFTQTAAELLHRVFESIWLLTAVWVGHAIVRRWLLMTRRRLAYDAAVAAREAARARQSGDPTEAGEQSGTDDIGAPEVDLVALDADSRSLLNAAMVLLAMVGFAGIWGPMLPALGILKDVELWNKTSIVDGVEGLVPVTLANLLLAVLIGIGGYVTAKNLPSLLDIILLKRGKITAGGRYAVSTLSRYAIVTVATLLVLGALGASWGQMGWAVAALSVGIGFGLQEIVANFICGLILLFERPVRVGDVVTVGEASGTVTRIRIRATTIRDWERKELVVPNKELITGRLLNWTLSDAVTRVLVTVGVAYGSDVDRAMALLREVARENQRVLEEPMPLVTFEQFGDSSLSLNLRAYVGALSERLPAITELHGAIDQKFRAAGIVIAFPQRDVHLRSGDANPPTQADSAVAGKERSDES